MIKFPRKLFSIIVAIIAILVVAPMMFGINDAGHRTVIQYPSGKLNIKFSPGIYVQWFGTVTTYKDVITFDFDKTEDGDASIDQKGIAVRYQDGGVGTVFGKSRYTLPIDTDTMMKLHKAFRSNRGVSLKLIKSITEEGLNLTAGLMTSEEAYAEKRGIYTQWAELQVSTGKFQTELKEIMDVEEGTGRRVLKNIPVIKFGEDGRPLQFSSDFIAYGINVSGFQITDWGFEKKTLDQIARKREATMAIITAKADAERAKQEAITAEEQGKANVMKAKYEKEVEKEKAVVMAEQQMKVAVINAQRQVAVAEQQKLEAEQKKLAAAEYKQEQTLRGEGDGNYKRLVMAADGALQQKLATYEKVMGKFAYEFGRQKWVPEVMMGEGGGKGNEAANLINILTARSLKDLGLDMTIPKGSKAKR